MPINDDQSLKTASNEELRCPFCHYSLTGLTEYRCPECGNVFNLADVAAEQVRRAKASAVGWILGSATVVYMVGLAASSAGHPKIWSPLPVTVILPAFMTESLVLAPLPLAVVWALWAIPLAWRDRRVRWWSIGGFAILCAISACWLAVGWSLGSKYEGVAFTRAVAAINVICVVGLIGLLMWNCLRRSFATNLMFHLAVGCWLASYAFPYLGELL